MIHVAVTDGSNMLNERLGDRAVWWEGGTVDHEDALLSVRLIDHPTNSLRRTWSKTVIAEADKSLAWLKAT
jgi:hypothetical protein